MRLRNIAALAAIILLLSAPFARADYAFDVTLDTSPLVSNPAGGPYAIDFTLIDGSGTNNADNTATISGFLFGGGAPNGSASLIGGANGDLSGTVTLTDSTFFNDFNQAFDAGGMLTFRVNLTANVDTAPDTFAFAILDNTGNTLPTSDPLGGDALFRVTIDGTSPTIETFSGLVGPPIITTRPVPEPSSLALCILGSLGLLAATRRRTGKKFA